MDLPFVLQTVIGSLSTEIGIGKLRVRGEINLSLLKFEKIVLKSE